VSGMDDTQPEPGDYIEQWCAYCDQETEQRVAEVPESARCGACGEVNPVPNPAP